MKYLVAEGRDQEEIAAYIDIAAHTVVATAPAKKNKVATLITADEYDAQFISGRLASGLMGGRIFDTEEEARDLYDWLIDTA